MNLGRYLKEMVVGEGLFVAALLTLRAVACGNVVSLSLDANLRQLLILPRSIAYARWESV